MSAANQFQPLRNIQDIEELERVPLEQRLLSWDVNDWIRHGCDLAAQKVAIRYVSDGNPESPAVTVTYRELKQRATAAANLFRSVGVGPSATTTLARELLISAPQCSGSSIQLMQHETPAASEPSITT